ncbi:MAG: hypothetical protein FWF34_02285 [Alphaproteobacteria bacterium]|nr:hypothetical protein [Alphaproteobacteria bacterium]MCL2890058.1 hypothetical protein [Alphaproteobacteria bacterium]
MKKLITVFMIALLATACEAPAPEETGDHIMNTAALFDGDCLQSDIAVEYECLGRDGCVTRAEWDAFMGYWAVNTPEPGISLCEQYKQRNQ